MGEKMSGFDRDRCLWSAALAALLLAGPGLLQSQAPAPSAVTAREQTPTPAHPAAEPPAATTKTATIAAVPPTPEELGDSLAAHQHYQAAIEAYSKAPERSAQLWNKMGIAYQMMFNLKDATRCYNASIKIDPKSAQVLNNLATVYDSLKDYGSAERLYRKALKYDPRSALILRNLGSNLLAHHKYKQGWQAYQQALAIDPQILAQNTGVSVQNPASVQERGAMHYYMARGCVSAGNPECAIDNLRLALNEGYINPKKVAADSSFASLRQLPAFQQLIAAQGAP